MTRRLIIPTLAALLAIAPAALSGCGEEAAAPTEATVRLDVIADAEHGRDRASLSTPMTQEVTTQPPYAGDPDGRGWAILKIAPSLGTVCWKTSVSRITLPATASHIHEAPVGVRGPIVVFLSPPDETGKAEGCASGVDPALLARIVADPASFYVNVHTTDFPPGAVRGQLDR